MPQKLRKLLLVTALALVGFLLGAGLLIGRTQDTDPGGGAFRFDYGQQTVSGVVENLAYPLFHVTEGNDRLKPGQTLMLTGSGKDGVSNRTLPMVGKLATAKGIVLERGSLEMLQLAGGKRGLSEAEKQSSVSVPKPEDLGRWKLTGEICDGKCLSGAMRPGRGLAHKACANLCLFGDIPPVFVSTKPVKGSEFLMVLGPDGGALPKEAYDFIGQYITLEGAVARHGDMLVFKMDPETIELAS
ncbi:conserved hypothetical protein [Rhodobacteraceae bacterium KLH11]|nr:conserved hypothetical protein [Rhodobacteraceae bacterium KLH11]